MKTKRNYLLYFLTIGAIIGILFSWSCKKEDPVKIPTLGNITISDIIASPAVITGSIEYDGGTALIDLGIVWNTTGNPSLESHEGKNSASLNEGIYTITLTELSPGTEYYVRVYATNSEGTAYSDQFMFTTPGDLATVTTSGITEITASSAVSGGEVRDEGGLEVTVRGIVWSTSENPDTDDNEGITEDGSGPGEFTSEMVDLQPATTYFVRAYSTNSQGTAYGEQKSFETPGDLATVTTSGITEITASSAVSGGEVKDEGGLEVTVRGVVWSISENPDTDDNQGITEDGSGPGIFISVLTGLSPKTTYYVRAYATNSAGTAYGVQESVETQEEEVITYTLTLSVSPSGSGEVTGTGNYHDGEEVEINANANDGYEFVNWTGDTKYISNADAAITTVTMPGSNISLTANFDDASGNDNGLTGEPCPGMPTFTDTRDGNVYNTVQIGDQCWLKENLRYLPQVSPSSAGSGTDPHYYVYDYQGTDVSGAIATDNYQNYGVLYNWSAAMNGEASSNANPSGVQGVCPAGWHLPGDGERTQLVNYVVDQGYPNSNVVNGAANALKSCRQVGSPLGGECTTSEHPRWNSHATHYGTDQFGFSALPGGVRGGQGIFLDNGDLGNWWSSTEYSSANAWLWAMNFQLGNAYPGISSKLLGFSVRCVRD